MNGKVYTAGTFRGMETLLLEKLEIIRESTPYSPIYILVGSNQLGVYLKRRLACLLSGIFNMHFINFLDLISLIEESVGGEPCQVQPVLAEELIIGEMVNSDEFTSRLSSVAGLKGIGGSLLETFTDLSESGCTGEIADNLVGQLAGSLPSHGNVSVPEVDKKLKAVLELYSIFKERVCKHGGDIHGRFRGAVQLSEKWFPQGNLMVYGFYDFNELQWRLIEAVSGRIETDFFVPWSKVRFFEFVKSTIARFSELAPEIDQTEPKEPQVEEPLEVFLVNTPGEDEEVKETVRTIIDYIKRESISFSDVGIFLTDHDTYIPLFREQLDKAGIPYYYAGRYCDGREQVVSAVLRLLELLDGDFSRSKLVDFMVSAPLKRFEDESAIDPYLRWIRESAEAGITGEDGWLEENNRLIERISDVADQPDRESMNAVRMVGDIISSILETGKQIRSAGSWSESAHIFSSLLRELFSPCKEQEFVCSAVERVGQLDNISTSVSPEVFSQLVRSSLQRCNGSHGSFGDGRVSLLSINRSRGLRFKLVFLVGMTEGRFPGKISQDPWLSDRERDRMNKMSHGDISLSMRGERMLENELLFKLAVDSCSQCLVCSYPRFEEETGRERIPSYFLRFIEDYSVWEKQEITLAVKRISRFGIREDIERAIDQNEYDYATSLSYRGGGSDLPGGLFFQRGVEMVRERRGRKSFTVYDGLLSSDSALKELKSYLREGGWRFSATSLETYASCPFRYFVEKILGMEPLEEPERIMVIQPIQRGLIVHELLECIYRELKNLGLLPLSSQSQSDVMEVVDRELEGYLHSYQQRESVGIPVFWEIEKRSICDAVKIFLIGEMRDESSLVPVYFEKRFGYGRMENEVAFNTKKRKIFFRGRIDRIDVGEDGNFRVIDYKTGKLHGRDNDLGGGSKLQLPVYLVAASKIVDTDPSRGEACYRKVSISEGKDTLTFTGKLWNRESEHFEDILNVLLRTMERGIFVAVPSMDSCRYCPVRVCCPTGKDQIFERKVSGEKRMDEFLRMKRFGI